MLSVKIVLNVKFKMFSFTHAGYNLKLKQL